LLSKEKINKKLKIISMFKAIVVDTNNIQDQNIKKDIKKMGDKLIKKDTCNLIENIKNNH